MVFFEFIFKSFWRFLGFILICGFALEGLKLVFDFFVELIHGKPTIQNLNIPADKVETTTKDLSLKENKTSKKLEDDNGFDANMSMDIGKIKVLNRKENGKKEGRK